MRHRIKALTLLLLVGIPLLTGGCALLMLPFKLLALPFSLLPFIGKVIPYALMFAVVGEEPGSGIPPTVIWEVASTASLDEEIELILQRTDGKILFFAATEVQSVEEIIEWEGTVLEAAPDGSRITGVVVEGAALTEDPERVEKLLRTLERYGTELIVTGSLEEVLRISSAPSGEYFRAFERLLAKNDAPAASPAS